MDPSHAEQRRVDGRQCAARRIAERSWFRDEHGRLDMGEHDVARRGGDVRQLAADDGCADLADGRNRPDRTEPRKGDRTTDDGLRRCTRVRATESGTNGAEPARAGFRCPVGSDDSSARTENAAVRAGRRLAADSISRRLRTEREREARDRRRLSCCRVRRVAQGGRRAGHHKGCAATAAASGRCVRRAVHVARQAACCRREVLHLVERSDGQHSQRAVSRRHGGRVRPAGRRGVEVSNALSRADSGCGRSHRLAGKREGRDADRHHRRSAGDCDARDEGVHRGPRGRSERSAQTTLAQVSRKISTTRRNERRTRGRSLLFATE